MSDRIHDEEFDTSEAVVRALLREQLPAVADAAVTRVAGTGTTNALWRVDQPDGATMVIRLPRMASGTGAIEREVTLLPALAGSALATRVELPRLVHVGHPSEAYPLPWLATDWVPGDDLWARRHTDAASPELAVELAHVVSEIATLRHMPAPDRQSGERGGPLGPLVERIHRWLDDPTWGAADLVDVAAVERLARQASELTDAATPRAFVHGDLIPGNVLVRGDRLHAVIDWGAAGHGDPAQDLAPAWAIFDETPRAAFREATEADDATWIRARTIELEHALGGVLYYVPRHHPLGDVMARTLARIIADGM